MQYFLKLRSGHTSARPSPGTDVHTTAALSTEYPLLRKTPGGFHLRGGMASRTTHSLLGVTLLRVSLATVARAKV